MENRKTENEWIRAVGRNREEELTAGIDDVSGNVLRGDLWGNGDFWDDMLDLWEEVWSWMEAPSLSQCKAVGTRQGNRRHTRGTKDSLMSDVTMVLFPTPSRSGC